MMPPIYFYLPPPFWSEALPTEATSPWAGFGLGVYAWTLQSYLRLKGAGFPCSLTPVFPDEGIVLAHRNVLENKQAGLKVGLNMLLICLKGELLPSPQAQIHIGQNPLEAARLGYSYLPHWPQPGLMPRRGERCDRIQTVAFFGHQDNLAPELADPAWATALQALGLQWRPRLSANRWHSLEGLHPQWHDYSDVDVIVAVRSFRPQAARRTQNYLSKPATKLYNAWLAGVPAILGKEAAYRAERRSPLDYLEATTAADVLRALRQLQQAPGLYRAMVENGLQRAAAVQPDAITQHWLAFLEQVAIPAYHRWCRLPQWRQRLVLGQRQGAAMLARLERKVRWYLFS